jgi:hypothetical protein
MPKPSVWLIFNNTPGYSYTERARPNSVGLFTLYAEGQYDGGPICATIPGHDVDNMPKLECLSYVWVDPSKVNSILVDDRAMPVVSLLSALVICPGRSLAREVRYKLCLKYDFNTNTTKRTDSLLAYALILTKMEA